MTNVASDGNMTSGHPRHAELVSASISPRKVMVCLAEWTLKKVWGDDAKE